MNRQARLRLRMAHELQTLRARPCECCRGRRFKRELAHVRETQCVGRGRGLERRYYDVLRNLDAYAVLCTKCHGEESLCLN